MIDSGHASDFGFMLAILMLVGFAPSEIWRVLAAVLAQRVDQASEIFFLVRLMATALVAAVIAKLLLSPPPALESVPLWGRGAAIATGILLFLMIRSVPLAVAGGMVTLVAIALLVGS